VRGGETIDGVELRVRRTDTGRERIFSYSGTRVEYGAGQQLAFMTLHDVTERHAAEAERARLLAQETAAREEAEQAHRQVDEILASVTDAWVTLDRDWRYVYVNERAARIFGRTREQLLGRHIWTEFPEGVGQPFQREYERAMRDRVEIQFEEYYPPLDAWFENRIFPSAEGISIVFQDISARKRAELALREAKADLERKVEERTAELQTALVQAEAADRIKSAFLATMSHELRTPLNSIIGFTGIVLQGLAGPLTPEQQKQLGMVRGSARHLLDLINDVLDISKIEAGQLEVRDEPVDLAALLERTVGTIRPLAAQKGLALETRIPDTLPALRSDRRRVEQILLNLLNNAVKFTDRGGVTLTVRAGPDVRLADRRPAVALAVADTGIGIRPADLQRLFQPFQQVDSGLSRQHEGTGLGLAICRRLAELLGGTITVQSTWGVGSTFTVTLPLAPGA
jgi:PAS domain S-box-containing protein